MVKVGDVYSGSGLSIPSFRGFSLFRVTISSATMRVLINGTEVGNDTATNFDEATTLSVTAWVNATSNVTVIVEWMLSGTTYSMSKQYTVPLAVGMWAAFLLLNNQLATMENSNLVGVLIAALVALAVAASLAYHTQIPGKGLGFITLVIFTMIAIPLGAIDTNIMVLIWVSVLGIWILWREL